MTKISKRLESLALFVEKKDTIIDVGCDHGLLSIFLKENKLCKKIIAADINQNALNNAIENIRKRNLDIETVLSDGIDNVDLKGINTLIISGMGTSTILHILKDQKKIKNINKLILQSNNDHQILRQELNNKGYYLKEEKVIFERNKWYVTMLFIKSNQKNTISEIEYGFLNNDEYNKYLISYHKKIVSKIPLTNLKVKFRTYKKIMKYKKAIKRKR